MKVNKFVLALLLLMTSSLCSFAQEPAGKFTLTHEVRWDGAVLPAGAYTVLVHSGPVPYVLVSSDNPKAASIMAVARYVESATCKQSNLELEQSETGWNVLSLCLESYVAVHFGAATEKLADNRPSGVPEVASTGGR